MVYTIYANENNCFASETTYVSYETTVMEDNKFYSSPYQSRTTGRHFNTHYAHHIPDKLKLIKWMNANTKWPVFIDDLVKLKLWKI